MFFILFQIFFSVGMIISLALIFGWFKNTTTVFLSDVTTNITAIQWIGLALIPVAQVLFYALFYFILEHSDVSTLSPARSVLGVVFLVIMGIAFLGERPDLYEGAALGIMIFGLIVMLYASYRKT